jgi:hypothetical protein
MHRTHAARPPLHFDGGETSVDALVARFLKALEAKDETALRRLRVTEKEYRKIIIPGTVKVGEKPREATEANSQFFWSMLNAKSEDIGRTFIKNFGGHHYKRKELKLSKGTRQFGWYTAHGNVELTLEDEDGQTQEIRTGTIAEVGGRYKFIGFNGK